MSDPAAAQDAGGGANSRPLDDTIAESGPGIPDDAASPGYDPVAGTEAERKREAAEPPPSPETLFNGP